jgi:hypothetical protein
VAVLIARWPQPPRCCYEERYAPVAPASDADVIAED